MNTRWNKENADNSMKSKKKKNLKALSACIDSGYTSLISIVVCMHIEWEKVWNSCYTSLRIILFLHPGVKLYLHFCKYKKKIEFSPYIIIFQFSKMCFRSWCEDWMLYIFMKVVEKMWTLFCNKSLLECHLNCT